MEKFYRTFCIRKTLQVIFSTVLLFASCDNRSGDIRVSRNVVDVGQINVGDTAWACYRIHNVGSDTITLNLLPECDCVIVNPEQIILFPNQKGNITIGYGIEEDGRFHRCVFVEQVDNDMFFTLVIRGESSGK